MNNNYNFISFNKEFLSPKGFSIDLSNRAFRYGDGFFESMHVNGLEVQFFDDHFERILESADLLKLELPDYFSKDFLRKQIAGLLSRMKLFQAARINLSIYRSGAGLYTPETDYADILIRASYLGKGPYVLNEEGITIGIFNEISKPCSPFGSIKSMNALLYILAARFAKKNDFDDALLINQKNQIIEATSSNLFAIRNKDLFTPSLKLGCVKGIMRKQILEIANNYGFTIYDNAVLEGNDLLGMDELFLTNAIKGIQYISGFKNKRYFKRYSRKFIFKLNEQAGINS